MTNAAYDVLKEELELAGDIIPKLVGVAESQRQDSSEPYVVPEACPVCGVALEAPESSPIIKCPNGECLGRHVSR